MSLTVDEFCDLSQAIKNGDLENVREHLMHGPDPTQSANALETALHVSRHREENMSMDMMEFRHHVENYDDESIYAYLSEAYASAFEQQDRMKAHQPAIVAELLNAGADPNQRFAEGNSPLHLAMRERAHPEVMRSLLDAGADVNARNEDGFSPLEMMAEMDRRDVQPGSVRALVEHGATVVPELVGYLAGKNRPQDVRLLLDLGFDPNARSQDGWTAMHVAFEHPDQPPSLPAVRVLLQHGADPMALNDQGQTPIDLATRQGDLTMVGLLGAVRREREALAHPPERTRSRERGRS